MTPADIIQTSILVIATILILVGIVFEERLIAFENRVWAKIKRKIRRLIKPNISNTTSKPIRRRSDCETHI